MISELDGAITLLVAFGVLLMILLFVVIGKLDRLERTLVAAIEEAALYDNRDSGAST